MNSYTSRQTAPKLYREDTGIASATRSNFWRNEKESGKKIKLIVNHDPFTDIDIALKRIYM